MASVPPRITSYQEDPYVQKNRWFILVILNLFTFMSTLDASIVNVALPGISHDLNLPVSSTQWIVTIYLMTICVCILFFGRLGDMFGKILVFRCGTILFIIGSALCGLSSSLSFLLAARVIQAVGASMTMANNLGIATDIFPKTERGHALGLIGTFVSLGSITGPGLGGLIMSALSWEYIFWVNVPIGIIVIFLGWRMLPKDIHKTKGRLDISGTLIFGIFIVCLFTGALLGQKLGYKDWRILIAMTISVVLLVVFIWFEWHKKDPMLRLDLFRNYLFSVSIICGFLVFVSNFCFNIIAPFYTQDILRLTAGQSGFLLMLFPIMMAIVAPLSGALSDKIGSEILTFFGLVVLVIAQIGLGFLSEQSSIIYIGVLIALLGIGSGLFNSPNNSLVMGAVPVNQLGSAGSVNSLIRNLGMVGGITFATTLLFTCMSAKAGYHVTGLIPGRPDIFLYAMHIVFLASAGICLLCAILTSIRLIQSRRRIHGRAV